MLTANTTSLEQANCTQMIRAWRAYFNSQSNTMHRYHGPIKWLEKHDWTLIFFLSPVLWFLLLVMIKCWYFYWAKGYSVIIWTIFQWYFEGRWLLRSCILRSTFINMSNYKVHFCFLYTTVLRMNDSLIGKGSLKSS